MLTCGQGQRVPFNDRFILPITAEQHACEPQVTSCYFDRCNSEGNKSESLTGIPIGNPPFGSGRYGRQTTINSAVTFDSVAVVGPIRSANNHHQRSDLRLGPTTLPTIMTVSQRPKLRLGPTLPDMIAKHSTTTCPST